jgi:hypothetical protein
MAGPANYTSKVAIPLPSDDAVRNANKRRCVKKALFRKFKDELVKVFGRNTKRVHQGRLDSAGHFSDPGLIVTAFDNVDFGERHGFNSFC